MLGGLALHALEAKVAPAAGGVAQGAGAQNEARPAVRA
jgi:hypothetical protein